MLQIYIISLCVVYLSFWGATILVPSLFLVCTSCFLIFAKAFRNGYEVAWSTARRSAAENHEMSGNGTAPSLAKMTEHSSRADWINVYWHHQIGNDETRTKQIFTFKVGLNILQLYK